jgi:ornithine carbamoyltransferase
LTEDVEEGVKGADFQETDAWVSMGKPEERWAQRIEQMRTYQANSRAMELTGSPDAKFLNCLPAFHNRDTEVGLQIGRKFDVDGMEVTKDVLKAEASVVWDEAENRVHTIKAVMVTTLGS